MAENTVSNHFLAAVGVDQLFDKVAASHLQTFYINALTQYRKEIQYERARLMRQNPLDYRAVREMDHELSDIVDRLREAGMDEFFTE